MILDDTRIWIHVTKHLYSYVLILKMTLRCIYMMIMQSFITASCSSIHVTSIYYLYVPSLSWYVLGILYNAATVYSFTIHI